MKGRYLHTIDKIRQRAYGFTVIELVVVILVLGVLAAVAAPRFIGTVDDATASAEVANAKAFFEAVQVFVAQNNRLPNDAGPGTLPADLQGMIPGTMFSTPSPAGGKYDWDGPPPHSTNDLKLSLSAGTTASATRFYKIMEQAADDGAPGTGWITASGNVVRFSY